MTKIAPQHERSFCRICFQQDEVQQLLSPCQCNGSMRFVHQECIIRWIKRFQEEMDNQNTTQSYTKLQSKCQICHYEINYTLSTKYELEWVSWEQLLQRQQKQKICIVSLLIFCLLCFLYAVIIVSVVDFKKNLVLFIIHCLILIGCVIGLIIILIFLVYEQYICKLCTSKNYHINSVERPFEQRRQMIQIQSTVVIEQTMHHIQ